MSIRLYVGNLPKELSRQELEAVFAEAGDSVSTKVITDRKTGECRGFGFVTVKTNEQADEIIEKFNGYMLKDNALKIEKALPRSKGKEEEQSASTASAPVTASADRSSRRKGGNNNSKSKQRVASSSSESVLPDPRWAAELEKLKQLLAAPTTNS